MNVVSYSNVHIRDIVPSGFMLKVSVAVILPPMVVSGLVSLISVIAVLTLVLALVVVLRVVGSALDVLIWSSVVTLFETSLSVEAIRTGAGQHSSTLINCVACPT